MGNPPIVTSSQIIRAFIRDGATNDRNRAEILMLFDALVVDMEITQRSIKDALSVIDTIAKRKAKT